MSFVDSTGWHRPAALSISFRSNRYPLFGGIVVIVRNGQPVGVSKRKLAQTRR